MAKKASKEDMASRENFMDMLERNFPQAIGIFLDSIYNKQSGERHGEAIGAFYKKLTDAGMPPEHATDLSKEYMLTVVNLMKVTRSPVEEEFVWDL